MAPRPSLLSIASHFFLPRFPLSDTRTELVQTEEEDGLVDLEAQNLGLDKAQGLAVDLDEALALLAVCDSSGGLLLAEALDRLNGRHFVRMCDEEVCRKVVRAGVVGRLVVVRFEMRFRRLELLRTTHAKFCQACGSAAAPALEAATHATLHDSNNT